MIHVSIHVHACMHLLFFRYLMVNSKDYRVVVVEPLLCPSSFRDTLAKAFFNHFTVRALTIIGSILKFTFSTELPLSVHVYTVYIYYVHVSDCVVFAIVIPYRHHM